MGQAWAAALTWKAPHIGLYGSYDVDMAETFFGHDYIYDWTHEDGTVSKSINGYKLMETSYIGNQLVNHIIDELVAHRDDSPRLAWIGEYLDDVDDESYPEDLKFLVRTVNSPFEHSLRVTPVQDACPPKVWIRCPELGQYVLYDRTTGGDLRIAAIPLLCAVGNGLGGGDYEGTNMELIGTWAMRPLEVCDAEPSGEDLTNAFRESE